MSKKEEDPMAEVLRDINNRISQLESDVRKLEEVATKIIQTEKDLINIVKEIGMKVINNKLEDKKKNGKKIQRNGELDNLYR